MAIPSLKFWMQIPYLEFLFWMLSICSSTSFIDIIPRKIAATVRYRPCRGSQAAIMFLASNIWKRVALEIYRNTQLVSQPADEFMVWTIERERIQ